MYQNMIAIKTADLTQNFKQIADQVIGGEKILVSRPRNENLVVITEREYNELDRLRSNVTHTYPKLMNHLNKLEEAT